MLLWLMMPKRSAKPGRSAVTSSRWNAGLALATSAIYCFGAGCHQDAVPRPSRASAIGDEGRMKVSPAGTLFLRLNVTDSSRGDAVSSALIFIHYEHLLNAPLPDSSWNQAPPVVNYLTNPVVWTPEKQFRVLIPPLLITKEWMRGDVFAGFLVIAPGFQPAYISEHKLTQRRITGGSECTAHVVNRAEIEVPLIPSDQPSRQMRELRTAMSADDVSWGVLIGNSGALHIVPTGTVLLRFSVSERTLIQEYLDTDG